MKSMIKNTIYTALFLFPFITLGQDLPYLSESWNTKGGKSAVFYKNATTTDNQRNVYVAGTISTFNEGLELKIQRKSVLTYAKENIVGTTVKHNKFEKPIQFTVKGIKEAINQPHEYIREKNIVILQADEYIKEAKFIKSAISTKNDREKMHYLEIEIKKKPSYIVIKENLNTKEISFYSIVDKLK